MSGPKSIALRLIAAAALWVALMLILGGLLLSNLFREPLEQSFEQRLGFLLESLIATVEMAPGGQVRQRQALGEPRFLRQYSGWYWQVGRLDDGTVLSRSRSMWDFDIALPKPDDRAPRRLYSLYGPLGQKLHVLESIATLCPNPGLIFVEESDLSPA